MQVPVPVPSDIKLLAASLMWPPSCFVSDATDKHGAALAQSQCGKLSAALQSPN